MTGPLPLSRDGPGPPDLSGVGALVTGGSRGIGLSVARRLHRAGARLVLCSRGGPGLEAAAEETDAAAVRADLAEPAEVEGLARAARDELGGAPDVLVNNAGVFTLAAARETSAEDFERHLAVNLAAPFRLVRAFLPEMLDRGSGALVHIGSVAGREAFPGNVAYSASKYGLRGMHEVLCVELDGTPVRSLLVEPGPVDTGAWDPLEERLGRDLPARSEMLAPGDVADAVMDLLAAGDRTELGLAPGS